ncbi:MAG: DUF4012 domain-containing protein [Chloroflexota bacterium]|nr:DUF4012 domain-containing protein [Chloroflexota bacterium]
MANRPPALRRPSSVLRRLSPRIELFLLLLLAPFLIFPRPSLTPWLLAVIPALWLCRWLAQGRLTARTPLDIPLLLLLGMTLIGQWATFDLARSFPKLCGILLGVALFYAMANGIRTRRGLWLAAALILAGGAAIAGMSLVGTQWAARKVPLLFPFLSSFYEQLPSFLRGIPRAESGFNANQVGGALVLFIPLAAALLLYHVTSVSRITPHVSRLTFHAVRRVLLILGLAAVLLLTTFVLLLTQSRMAYVAVALALLLLGATLGRRPRRIALVVLLLLAGLLIYYGPDRVGQALFGIPNLESLAQETSWAGRVEIWRRSLRVIRDHPLTGIGFDTLFPVIHARYPTFLIPAGHDVTHAHNLFLQTALDLGLPGLAAFVWLLLAFGRMMWQVWRRSESPAGRALAAGLFSGLVAHLTFGLADAIALGQKPGVFVWAFLGLGAALWIRGRRGREAEGQESERAGGIGHWFIGHWSLTIGHWSLLIGSLVILTVLGWGYGRVARAREWLSLIESDLAALQALPQGQAENAQFLLHQTRSDLLGLQSEFALPLALAPHLGWVPGYGADLAAAPRLLQMGLDLTAAGEALIEPLRPLTAASGGDDTPQAALDVLQAAQPQLARTLTTLERVQRSRQAIPTAQLSPRLREQVARLDRTLPLLESGVRGAMALPELLGASSSGPRTYLILVQNDDELRPTGGFISGVARVVVEQGRIVNLTFEDSYAVDDFSKAYPVAPRPFREVMGPVPWVFRDSNWSPDFPTSARMAVKLYRLRYEADGQHPAEVDGVVALDQRAIQLLVEALAPLEILEHPEPLTGENVIQAMRESWAPAVQEGATGEWWRQRKDFMGRTLTAAVHKVQEEPQEVNLAGLAWAALRALEERHLFVYLSESGPATESLHKAGWDGALADAPGDYLMVVDANLGFNKVNPLITESVSYTVDLRDPAHPQATLTLSHRHTGAATGAPCLHEARYDLTYEQMMHRCYWDYVRVYVPGESRLLEATAHPIPGRLFLTGEGRTGEAEILTGEGGRSVFAAFLVLAPGEQVETRFVYDLPPGTVEEAEGVWRYRLHIQKQGGTDANDVRVALNLPDGMELVAAFPPPSGREGDRLFYNLKLQTDLELEVRLRTR